LKIGRDVSQRRGRKEEKKRKKRKEGERERESKGTKERSYYSSFYEKKELCSPSFADRGEREGLKIQKKKMMWHIYIFG
jgi:hypothetical protein